MRKYRLVVFLLYCKIVSYSHFRACSGEKTAIQNGTANHCHHLRLTNVYDSNGDINAHLENTETAVQNRELDNERVNILHKNVATYGGLLF